MSYPPRMLLLTLWGTEHFCALPLSYDKAIAVATEKFMVPNTHVVRLRCPVRDMPPYVAPFSHTGCITITDNDSYMYACAGKHVVCLEVTIHEKAGKGGAGGGGGGGAGAVAGGGGGEGGDKAKGGDKGKEKKEAAPASKTVHQQLIVDTTAGKTINLTTNVTGDMAKGPPPGNYLGTLTVNDSFGQKFHGKQLGPHEVLTKFFVQEKTTARLLFRPRTVRPQIDILHPEESSLEVHLSLKSWKVTAAYPLVDLRPDGDRTRLRWFLRVKKGGVVEDLLTGAEAHGLFTEMLPETGPRPTITTSPEAPLTPAYPDVRPANAFLLEQSQFLYHMDRVLQTLGLPPPSRSTLITSWLPGVTHHKFINRSILNNAQLEPSWRLQLIPAPQVLMRLLILYRGVPESERNEWPADRVVSSPEQGVPWRETVGWTPHLNDESLFRVIEYGTM
ncbi:uncharacterized protein COLE_06840 [Cutaneotrichosporon oleaginosum]|uniref:uncharacterized protein n=1 Tax=Cutaneotrichosporon oleaginosum TaxID=879819 RepID=UPI0013288C7F|nr:hypothetical protein COLE_06840 [Cutaneotrichosporon oleaginosum]